MKATRLLTMMSILTLSLCSCDLQPTGILKQVDTGLVTDWKGVTVKEARIVMNNEVLNHHDIPLGESFEIINDGVKGFTEKDGKTSVGCALTISDTRGKVLLTEDDLFKGQDLYEKGKMNFLRCTVNTGAPMEWDEQYTVTVKFWDKYGKGVINNTLIISIRDEG